MTTSKARTRGLKELTIYFIEFMEYGHSFRFYCGTNAHDEDYIEYDIYRFYYIADSVYKVEWYNAINGERRSDLMDWDELIDWLGEKWD